MKKYLVVGLSVSSLLVGCGQDDTSTKNDTPKSEQIAKKDEQADKKVDDAKRDEFKDAEKSDGNASKDNENTEINTESGEEKIDIVRYKFPPEHRSSIMPIGYFEALKHGMSYEEVARTLRGNAVSALQIQKFDTKLIEYVYVASETMKRVQFKDGKLFSADYTGTNTVSGTLPPIGWDAQSNKNKSDDHMSTINEDENSEITVTPSHSTASVKLKYDDREGTNGR
ncbi:hypothetical protein ACT1UG_29000 [Bacillus paramycoides]|uniref:hypothetical protein n=1 Tax=Bacillus paramycoides TaxID=2026194 RepID=UPI004058B0ED